MLHACITKLDVTKNFKKFLVFKDELNKAIAKQASCPGLHLHTEGPYLYTPSMLVTKVVYDNNTVSKA